MNYIKQHKKNVIITASGILFAFSLYIWLTPAKIAAYSVAKQDYVPSLLLSGEVIAERSILLSTLSSGTVLECPTAKGTSVKKGQLLVQIDDSQARLDRDRAAAAVQIAVSRLEAATTVTRSEAHSNSIKADLEKERAGLQYKRFTALFAAGAVSQIELEQAERNLTLAQQQALAARAAMQALDEYGSSVSILQAELQQRQLDLAEKEILLDKYKVLSPADGILLDLYIKPGELVTSGSQVALLAAGEGLRIRIQPDQRYAALAALGNKASVWLTNSAASKWDAQVVYTEPSGNAEQGSLTAELSLVTHVPQLYQGQLVSVQLFGPTQQAAIILPDSYLTVQTGQSGVWLVIGNRAHFTPLQIGIRTAGGVVITNGLQDGDLVLKPTGLQEDQRVVPLREKV